MFCLTSPLLRLLSRLCDLAVPVPASRPVTRHSSSAGVVDDLTMYSAISRSSSETSLELYDFGPLSASHDRPLAPPLWLLNGSHHELKIRLRRRRLFWLQASPILVTIVLIILTAIFNPSYTSKPPSHTGKNTLNEKVFIAAAIVDADLIRGAWGNAVLELIAVIGSENVFLSVYNNDSGPDTKAALEDLAQLVSCRCKFSSDLTLNPTS